MFCAGVEDTPLKIAIVETQSAESLADPAFDGREIALTHFSEKVLRELGIWQRFDANDVSDLRDAKVLNGPSLQGMNIEHRHSDKARSGT